MVSWVPPGITKPLQRTAVPQENRVESKRHLGGTAAAERQGVGQAGPLELGDGVLAATRTSSRATTQCRWREFR
jgi:hypothetical protein